MLLQQVSNQLSKIRRSSLADLATHLAIEPDALRGMLGLLEGKGRVRKVMDGSTCGSCSRCDPAMSEIYEWIKH